MGNDRSRSNGIDWLAKGSFAPHIDAYKQYLTERGYAANTFNNCMRSVAHFAQWARSRRLRALARLQLPDTKLRRYHAPDSLMKFLQTL